MNRVVIGVIAAVALVLVGLQMFLNMKNRPPAVVPVQKELLPQSTGLGPPGSDSPMNDERATAVVRTLGDRTGTLGAIADILIANDLLSESVQGMLVKGGEGWELPPDLDIDILSGIGAATDPSDDAAGRAILARFSAEETGQNARTLAQLGFWVRAAAFVEGDDREARRGRLLEMPEFADLPETIIVENAVIYADSPGHALFGQIPAQILDRVVFRKCLLQMGWTAEVPHRVRLEQCILDGGFDGSKAPLRVELKDCLSGGMSVMGDVQLMAENCLLISPMLPPSGSSVEKSVILGGFGYSADPPAGLVMTQSKRWVSEGLQDIPEAQRRDITRFAKFLPGDLDVPSASR